jgi:hypothetical protein
MSPRTEEERKHMAQIPYANAVGALIYAMVCTRPDIFSTTLSTTNHPLLYSHYIYAFLSYVNI